MNLKPILHFIGHLESRNDFNAVWGRIKKIHRPKKPLTTMTVREVLAWQDTIDPLYQSEAAGCWQFMEDTLRGLLTSAKVGLDEKFDEDTQTRLAIALLKRRGLMQYMKGGMTDVDFANSLAKEWASLPVVSGSKYGRSYYDGDGLNSAGTTPEKFLAAIKTIKDSAVPFEAPTLAPEKEIPMSLLITNEINRILRHLLTPVVVGLVATGTLPEAISQPLTETVLIGASYVLTLIWSKFGKR